MTIMEGSCKLRLFERFMEKNTTTPGAAASILRSGKFKSSGSSDLLPAGERPENVYEYNSTLLTKQIAKANTRSCHVVSASFFHIDDACVKQSHYFDSMENQRTYFRFVQQGISKASASTWRRTCVKLHPIMPCPSVSAASRVRFHIVFCKGRKRG